MPSSPRTVFGRVDAQLSHHGVRVIATLISAVVLLGAAAAAAAPERPATPQASRIHLTDGVLPVPVELPVQVAPRKASTTLSRPAVRQKAVAKPAKPPVRWLPTGTGMWIHEYPKTEGGNARAIVARAKQVGLTTLYVQTGSSKKGWIGSVPLSRLLPLTRGTDIKVVAWDFPTLRDPVKDAKRMASAARYTCKGCPRIAAVAPDVETAAEGTRISVGTVTTYYKVLRTYLPANIAILATVPWPSEKRVGSYPYQRTASLSDALMPMAYWYNRSPAGVTAASMYYLRKFHRPIMPIGQGYDGRLDAPYLAADPNPEASVRAFLTIAHRAGARAVSLWSWQTAGGQQWKALKNGHVLFRRA